MSQHGLVIKKNQTVFQLLCINRKHIFWYIKITKPQRKQMGENHKFFYRHSLIYAVDVETQKKNAENKNRVNRGYLVVLKGRKIG